MDRTDPRELIVLSSIALFGLSVGMTLVPVYEVLLGGDVERVDAHVHGPRRDEERTGSEGPRPSRHSGRRAGRSI